MLEIPQDDILLTDELLGKGGFGSVYLVDYNGRNAAAKVVQIEHDLSGTGDSNRALNVTSGNHGCDGASGVPVVSLCHHFHGSIGRSLRLYAGGPATGIHLSFRGRADDKTKVRQLFSHLVGLVVLQVGYHQQGSKVLI